MLPCWTNAIDGALCRPEMVDLSALLGDDEVEEEFGLAELARWVEEDW